MERKLQLSDRFGWLGKKTLREVTKYNNFTCETLQKLNQSRQEVQIQLYIYIPATEMRVW